MSTKKRKRQLEKKNKADARKVMIITFIITFVLVFLGYLAFLNSQ